MKNFGFGCMRLPMTGDKVDIPQFEQMVDAFLAAGFTYFDTAHGYLDGLSETAIRQGLTSRHPHTAYTLTDKLTADYFEQEQDIRPLFAKQLAACGVDYFDYYLMHAQMASNYDKFERCHAYQIAQQLKAEGLVRHVGISFHDTPAMLERILTDHPEIEVVQIQFNYADYDNPSVQSKAVYDVCARHGKPVIVMEPCKGGTLVSLPPQAARPLDELAGGSHASYAIRYAASFPQVFMVLSGMSSLAQVSDNISFMKDFRPLDDREMAAVEQVRHQLASLKAIPCTACRYCTAGCPAAISIPDLFACYNAKMIYKDWNSDFYYTVHTQGHGKASDCRRCGRCEQSCPQHLPIRSLLTQVAATFEKTH